jgi:hypothetical protein
MLSNLLEPFHSLSYFTLNRHPNIADEKNQMNINRFNYTLFIDIYLFILKIFNNVYSF